MLVQTGRAIHESGRGFCVAVYGRRSLLLLGGITRVLGTEIEIAGKCATRAAVSDQ